MDEITSEIHERWDTVAPRIRIMAMADTMVYALVRLYLAKEIDRYDDLLEQLLFYMEEKAS